MASTFMGNQYPVWSEYADFCQSNVEQHYNRYPSSTDDVSYYDEGLTNCIMPTPHHQYALHEQTSALDLASVYNMHANPYNSLGHLPNNLFSCQGVGNFPHSLHEPYMAETVNTMSLAQRQASPMTTTSDSSSSFTSQRSSREHSDLIHDITQQIQHSSPSPSPHMSITLDNMSQDFDLLPLSTMILTSSSYDFNGSYVDPRQVESTQDTDMDLLSLESLKFREVSFKREPYYDDLVQGMSSYEHEECEKEHERYYSPTIDSGVSLPSPTASSEAYDSDYHPSHSHSHRRRQSTRTTLPTIKLARNSKITKRKPIISQPMSPTTTIARTSSPTTKSSTSSSKKSKPTENGKDGKEKRSYTCPLTPYGCSRTFPSKNEWKRHIRSQHLNTTFYRCDLCPDAVESPNDFGRKDLFTQHLRRMHMSSASSEEALEGARVRCLVSLREPPKMAECARCGEGFGGIACSEEWLEHLGGHLRKGEEMHWELDEILRRWLVDEGLIEMVEGVGWRGVDGEGLVRQRCEAVARREKVIGYD